MEDKRDNSRNWKQWKQKARITTRDKSREVWNEKQKLQNERNIAGKQRNTAGEIQAEWEKYKMNTQKKKQTRKMNIIREEWEKCYRKEQGARLDENKRESDITSSKKKREKLERHKSDGL